MTAPAFGVEAAAGSLHFGSLLRARHAQVQPGLVAYGISRDRVAMPVSEQGDTVAVQEIRGAMRHNFVGEIVHNPVALFERGDGAFAPQGFQVTEQAAKQ